MKKTVVLQPRQHQPAHQPDPALDRAIDKHRSRMSARLALYPPTARAELTRHFANRAHSKRGFRS